MTYTVLRLGTIKSQNNLRFLISPMTNHRLVSGSRLYSSKFSRFHSGCRLVGGLLLGLYTMW